MVNTTAFLDPDVVIFSGGICARWPLFFPSLSATVEANLHLQQAPRIELAKLGEDRGLWDALLLVPENLGGGLE